MELSEKELKDRFSHYADRWGKVHNDVERALRFASNDQWKEKSDNRANLVNNQIFHIHNRFVGGYRLKPVGFSFQESEGVDFKTALALTKEAEDWQIKSGAYKRFNDSLSLAGLAGVSFCILGTDYLNKDQGLEQGVTIDCPETPVGTYLDPASKDVDDAEDAGTLKFVSEDFAKRMGIKYDKDRIQYILPSGMVCPPNMLPQQTLWIKNTDKKDAIYLRPEMLMALGIEGFSKLLGENEIASFKRIMNELTGSTDIPEELILGQRKENTNYIQMFDYIGGAEVLKTRMDISYVPVIPWYGWNDYSRGANDVRKVGLSQILHDLQVASNLNLRAMAERVEIAPKSPYWFGLSQFNNKIKALLDGLKGSNSEYLVFDDSKNQSPPQRADVSAHVNEYLGSMNAVNGMLKESVGMNQNHFGGTAYSGESGRAVQERNSLGDYQTAELSENHERSIQHTGKVWLQLKASLSNQPLNISVKTGNRKESITITSEDLNSPKIANALCVIGQQSEVRKRTMTDMLKAYVTANPNDARIFMVDIAKQEGASDELISKFEKMVPAEFRQGGIDPAIKQITDTAKQTIEQLKQALEQTNEQYEQTVSELRQYIIKQDQDSKNDRLKIITDTKTAIQLQLLKGRQALQQIIAKQTGEIQKIELEALLQSYQDSLEVVSKIEETAPPPVVSGEINEGFVPMRGLGGRPTERQIPDGLTGMQNPSAELGGFGGNANE